MVAGSSAVFRRTAAAPMGLLEKSAAYSAPSHAIKRLFAYSWTAGAAKLRADSGRYLAGSRPHTHRGSGHKEVIAAINGHRIVRQQRKEGRIGRKKSYFLR